MQARCLRHFLEVNRLGVLVLAVLEQVVRVGHDSDADHVVVQRDVPEPALLAFSLNDERRSFIAARVAASTLPVRPQRGLLQLRVPLAQSKSIDDQRALAAGVDHHLRPHFALGAVFGLHANADRTGAFEQHLNHAGPFAHLHAVVAGMVERKLVELAAPHLPGLARFVRLVVLEVERFAEPALLVDELHAVLLDEVAAFHLGEQPGALEREVRVGDHRFADVEARKVFALEQLDRVALLCQDRGDGAARRAAANNDDVGIHNDLPFSPPFTAGVVETHRKRRAISAPHAFIRLVRRAGRLQQGNQLHQVRRWHVPELLRMAGTQRASNLVDERDTGLGNRHQHGSAILRRAGPGDEPALFQFVHQSRDVRGPRHESLGEYERGKRLGMLGPQQPQRVVLLGGEVEPREEFVFEHPQAVVGSPQREVRLLLGRVESPGRLCRLGQGRGHMGIILLSTIVVQTIVSLRLTLRTVKL